MIFVVIAEARSGSHYFENTLDCHPDIKCCYEILPNNKNKTDFHHYWIKRIKKDRDAILPHGRAQIFKEYLDYLEAAFPEKKAIVIDIKYHQISWIPSLLNVLKLKQLKVIHLVRQNTLKLWISNFLNQNKQELNRPLHTRKGQPGVTPVKINIDLNNLLTELDLLRDKQNKHRQIISQNFDHIETAYEDCLNYDPNEGHCINPKVLDSVYNFIGIDNKIYDLSTSYTKMNSNSIADLVGNYQEVYEALKNTKWKFVLDNTL